MNVEAYEQALDVQFARSEAERKADCGDPDDARDDEFAARWEGSSDD